jgi:hypothetical protein
MDRVKLRRGRKQHWTCRGCTTPDVCILHIDGAVFIANCTELTRKAQPAESRMEGRYALGSCMSSGAEPGLQLDSRGDAMSRSSFELSSIHFAAEQLSLHFCNNSGCGSRYLALQRTSHMNHKRDQQSWTSRNL